VALVVRLGQQMKVIVLDGEGDHPEAVLGRRGDAAPHDCGEQLLAQ
jgi:hypothetical protein